VADVDALVAAAARFERHLAAWGSELDPSWHDSPAARWLTQVAQAPTKVRVHVAAAVFARWCGALPPPEALLQGVGAWALAGRAELLSRLCTLALARRPGVLRCCIDGPTRHALRRALGESFDRLREQARGGRALPADLARREPVAWACVGYRDAVRAGLLPWRSLRRMTRLSLPRRWPQEARTANSGETADAAHRASVAAAIERVVELRGAAAW
jgi:hypothetical protein